MFWTDITRAEHNRNSARYPTDLTDAEWAMVSPLVPRSRPSGRPRTSDMREVMNAILYIAGGGIPWRMLPKDFPTVSTVRGYFYRWRNDGTHRRAKILCLKPAGRCHHQDARRRNQGQMGLRTGAPTTQGGAWARPLRRQIMDGITSTRLDDDDRLRLPPVPPH